MGTVVSDSRVLLSAYGFGWGLLTFNLIDDQGAQLQLQAGKRICKDYWQAAIERRFLGNLTSSLFIALWRFCIAIQYFQGYLHQTPRNAPSAQIIASH